MQIDIGLCDNARKTRKGQWEVAIPVGDVQRFERKLSSEVEIALISSADDALK
jgi:hypothetical protein